jgi:DNA polymerase-3 subunit delta
VKARSSRADGLSSLDSLKRDLADGKRYDVVALTGQDVLLIQTARDLYLNASLDSSQRGFDLCELRGSELKGHVLWNELTSLPFMADRRVVLIDSPKEIKQGERAALTKYLAHPVSTTSLVLIQIFEDRRDKLAAWSSKGSVVFEFPELREPARAKWIAQYVKKSRGVIKPEAIQHLVETSSAQLTDLRTKLDNSLLYLGDEKEITVATLMKIGGISSDYDIFKLQDELLRGNASEALKISKSLIEGGLELLALMGMMRGFLMRTWQVEAALSRPRPDEIIAEVLGGQKFKSNEFRTAAKRLGRERLRQLVVDFLELEIHAKSKSSDTVYGFYDWIWCFSTPKSNGTRTVPLAYTG